MINRAQLAALNPTQRADLIYRTAQADLAQGLWRAALGDGRDRESQVTAWSHQVAEPGALNTLLELMTQGHVPKTAAETPASDTADAPVAVEVQTPSSTDIDIDSPLRVAALGPNACFAEAINRAAERTGLPATALASIIDAEAGRGRNGAWNVHSRNPRSSAAGLGQFLSGTWETEAERPGTWLNGEARRQGWLSETGRVTRAARSSLLALRYNPEANIQAIADYAHGNLRRLERAGVRLDQGVESVARAAYLGHHLGAGDAAKFLNGGLDPARARRLLEAQVGHSEASRRLAETGNATDAHRRWLLAYTERRINPGRFG